MRICRYILLIATAGWLVAFLYILWNALRHGGVDAPLWLVVAILGPLCLNLVYVWYSQPGTNPGRLARLFSLWLDAKETELKNRAKHEG